MDLAFFGPFSSFSLPSIDLHVYWMDLSEIIRIGSWWLLAFPSLLDINPQAHGNVVVAFHPRVFQGIEIHEEREVKWQRTTMTEQKGTSQQVKDKLGRVGSQL